MNIDPAAIDVFTHCPMSDDLMARLADALGEFDARAIQLRVLIAMPGDIQVLHRGQVRGIAIELTRRRDPALLPLIDEITAALNASAPQES